MATLSNLIKRCVHTVAPKEREDAEGRWERSPQ